MVNGTQVVSFRRLSVNVTFPKHSCPVHVMERIQTQEIRVLISGKDCQRMPHTKSNVKTCLYIMIIYTNVCIQWLKSDIYACTGQYFLSVLLLFFGLTVSLSYIIIIYITFIVKHLQISALQIKLSFLY